MLFFFVHFFLPSDASLRDANFNANGLLRGVYAERSEVLAMTMLLQIGEA